MKKPLLPQKSQDRARRQAEALRANLKRRKEAAKARESGALEGDDGGSKAPPRSNSGDGA